jgi:hypothetical protein
MVAAEGDSTGQGAPRALRLSQIEPAPRSVQDGTVRHVAQVLCATAVMLAMTACGGSERTPVDKSRTAFFPVTITRIGGVAGFQDVVVVAGDGLVSVTRKGQQRRQCKLTRDAAERLAVAASRVPWSRIQPAGTRPAFPDDLVTVAQTPAGGPVRLEGPQAGAGGQVLLALLNDLSRGPTASLMCKPV